jgi:hypothetical protein
MLKYLGFIVGMIIVALLVFFFALPAEDQFLDSLVSTGPEITLDAWRELFRYWAALGIVVALSAAVFWFALGQWAFSMNDWTSAAKKRWVWLGLLVLAAIAAVPGFLLTPAVQEGGRVAWFFYPANNLLVFYVATLMFSPASFKYIPAGASSVRYW